MCNAQQIRTFNFQKKKRFSNYLAIKYPKKVVCFHASVLLLLVSRCHLNFNALSTVFFFSSVEWYATENVIVVLVHEAKNL